MYLSLLNAICIVLAFLSVYIFVQIRRTRYPRMTYVLNHIYSFYHQSIFAIVLLVLIDFSLILYDYLGIFTVPSEFFKYNNLRLFAPYVLGFITFLYGFRGYLKWIKIDTLTFESWHYQKGNWLATWYKKTYRYNEKRNYSKNLFSIIRTNFEDHDKNKLVFVSPSANAGKYEENLYGYFVEEKNSVTFIVSDLVSLDHHVPNQIDTHTDSKLFYLPERNAENIKETLQECNIDSCDVVYDHKGYLWYSSTTDELEKKFKIYHDVLNEKGVIVVDAYKSRVHTFNNLVFHLLRLCIGSLEQSTYRKLRKKLRSSDFIGRNFNVKYKTVGKSKFVLFEKRRMVS